MPYDVILSGRAVEDLNGYHAYYLATSLDESVANKVEDKILREIKKLSSLARLCPNVYDCPGFKKLICGKFVIPFKIDEETKTVHIARIFHGAMNYQKLL